MRKIHLILRAIIIAWMLVIFLFSGQEGEQSAGLSRKIAKAVIDVFDMDAGITEETERIELLENVQYFIRKMAHFCEYGLLSCIVYLTVITGEISKKTIKLIEMNGWQIWWKMGIITQCMVTGYAITDEFHQMFVADRYPAVTDVLIDSAGGFTAVVGMTIIFMIARHVKNNKLKKQENALQDGGLT